MKKIICFFTFIVSYSLAFSTVFTTVSDGNWSSASTWDANGKPGNYFGADDQVVINHNINLNQNVNFAGSLSIKASGSLKGSTNNLSLNDGASIVANGETTFNNLTLNSTSSGIFIENLTINNNLTVGSGSTLISSQTLIVDNNFNNNGGDVTTDGSVVIGNNLTNNNGNITFNEGTSIGGNFNNNNGNSKVIINDNLTVSGNFQNNSEASITINSGSQFSVDGSMANNSGSEFNNAGTVNSNGSFDNNGGTVQNDGAHFIEGDFTQNGGTYTNDGVLVAKDELRVNNNGTVEGSGIIRADEIVNYGSITGTNDICGVDDSTPSHTTGNGFGANTTDCEKSASEALPIELVYFKIKSEGKTLIFEWLTSSEINNDFFEIQYSTDGVDFTTLIVKSGAGNSYQPISYLAEFTALNPIYKGYYRLKQTDFNGDTSFSELQYYALEDIQNESFKLYPNPTSGEELFISIMNQKASQFSINIYNSQGKLIIEKKLLNLSENSSIEILNGYQLKSGLYYFLFQADLQIEKGQFIVK